MFGALVDHKDQVDDDVEERLAEDHQSDKHQTQQTAEELRTEHRTAELATQHERIPTQHRDREH